MALRGKLVQEEEAHRATTRVEVQGDVGHRTRHLAEIIEVCDLSSGFEGGNRKNNVLRSLKQMKDEVVRERDFRRRHSDHQVSFRIVLYEQLNESSLALAKAPDPAHPAGGRQKLVDALPTVLCQSRWLHLAHGWLH